MFFSFTGCARSSSFTKFLLDGSYTGGRVIRLPDMYRFSAKGSYSAKARKYARFPWALAKTLSSPTYGAYSRSSISRNFLFGFFSVGSRS